MLKPYGPIMGPIWIHIWAQIEAHRGRIRRPHVGPIMGPYRAHLGPYIGPYMGRYWDPELATPKGVQTGIQTRNRHMYIYIYIYIYSNIYIYIYIYIHISTRWPTCQPCRSWGATGLQGVKPPRGDRLPAPFEGVLSTRRARLTPTACGRSVEHL
jgi:hypothetical protein